MIALIIYLIGIFITPIVLKSFKFKLEDETIVTTISIAWPLSIFFGIFFIVDSIIIYIYKKF